MEENKDTRKSRLVFDGRICRALIKRGMKVIDCKPLKTDKTRTVLVFENSPEFQVMLDEITAEFKAKDDAAKRIEAID